MTHLEAERYLGKWYEIARLDHSFERGLEHISAEYNAREDGGIRVLNRGFDTHKQKWHEVEGQAKFVGARNVGQFKVSFFGPFYGGYNIIELDPNYQYAMVTSYNRNYLWILARSPNLAPEVRERLVNRARALGFATEQLIEVKHR